jgi:hypothetical protein
MRLQRFTTMVRARRLHDGRAATGRRGRALVAALAVAASLVGVGATAEARGGGEWTKITVHFDVENYEYQTFDVPCDPAAPANCVYISKIPAFQTTGDLVGTGVEGALASIAQTNLFIGTGIGMFSGTVRGCGTGTFVYLQATRFDITSNTGRTRYTISPGTGSGELEGITGWFEEGVGPVRCHPH